MKMQNIKGCIAARNEPANAPLVEYCLAAMSGILKRSHPAEPAQQDHPGFNTLGL